MTPNEGMMTLLPPCFQSFRNILEYILESSVIGVIKVTNSAVQTVAETRPLELAVRLGRELYILTWKSKNEESHNRPK